MKKVTALLTVLILLFSACSNSGISTSSENPSEEPVGVIHFGHFDLLYNGGYWDGFINNVNKGKTAIVAMEYICDPEDPRDYQGRYFTDRGNEYPEKFHKTIFFDGEKYIVAGIEEDFYVSRKYEYMLRFEGEFRRKITGYSSYIFYVLLNDNTLTWDEIYNADVKNPVDYFIAYSDIRYGSLKVYEEDVGTFSYQGDVLRPSDGGLGIRTDGFDNIEISPVETIEDVIKLAKKEISFNDRDFDSINLAYDEETDIYRVTFSKERRLGGWISVYVNRQGQTIRIVGGE